MPSLFALIPAPYRWLAGGIAILAVFAVLAFAVGKYNDSIREPLKREVKFLTDSINAQKKQAADRYAQLEKERDEAAEKWRKYAITEQDSFDSQMRDARNRHDNSGMRFTDPAGRGCSGGSPETKTEGSTGVPASGTPEGRVSNEAGAVLSPEATRFLKDQALLADQAAIYAQAARRVALQCLSAP